MEDDPTSSPVVELTDYIAILKRRKLLILACVLLMGLAALLLSQLGTTTYSSSTRVLVEPISVDELDRSVPPSRLVDLATERQVVLSRFVSQAVIDRQQLQSTLPNRLLKKVEVSFGEDSQILTVRCTQDTPASAKTCARQFALEYQNFRNQQAKGKIEPELASQRAELIDIEESAQATQADIAGAEADDPRLPQLEASLQKLNDDARDLRQATLRLEGQFNRDYVLILEAQEDDDLEKAPVTENATNVPLNVIIGLIFGGLIGTGLAFLRDRTDDTLKDSGESLERLGLRVLTAIPRPGSAIVRRRGEGALEDADSAISEAHRRLRSNVMFLSNRDNTRVLLVTSPQSDAGITTVSANLGVSLARAGKRVLIVSAALRNSTMHDLFRLPNTRGLSNVLQSPALAPEVIQSALGMSHLGVLVAGPTVNQPAELLSRATFPALLRTQLEKYDIIIIEGPPVLTVSDALAVAPYSDGVLLVVDNEFTTRTDVRDAVEQLQAVGGSVLGSVLLNSRSKNRQARSPKRGRKNSDGGGSAFGRWGRDDDADPQTAARSSNGSTGLPSPVDAGKPG